MATTPMQPFAVGDRVVYRDPERPRDPLAGEVVEVTEHAISVRYDSHPQAPGLISTQHAADVLTWEQFNGLTPPRPARDYWLPGADR